MSQKKQSLTFSKDGIHWTQINECYFQFPVELYSLTEIKRGACCAILAQEIPSWWSASVADTAHPTVLGDLQGTGCALKMFYFLFDLLSGLWNLLQFRFFS